jgi:hypothetical protein
VSYRAESGASRITAVRIVRLVRWRDDECLDQGGQFGMAGDELGEETDPAVDTAGVEACGGAGVFRGVVGMSGRGEGDRKVEVRICQGLVIQDQAQHEFGGGPERLWLAGGEEVAKERVELPRVV